MSNPDNRPIFDEQPSHVAIAVVTTPPAPSGARLAEALCVVLQTRYQNIFDDQIALAAQYLEEAEQLATYFPDGDEVRTEHLRAIDAAVDNLKRAVDQILAYLAQQGGAA